MFCIMRTEKRKRTDLGGIQREKTAELQKQIEQLQEERNNQHKSLLKLTEAKHKAQKEVNGLNYTIKDKQTEFEAIKEDVEEVKEYLTEGQQNRLAEIDREWNDAERE